MKKIVFKTIPAFLALFRTGTIFEEQDITVFIVKGLFIIIFFIIAFILLTSKRSKRFIKELRKNSQ